MEQDKSFIGEMIGKAVWVATSGGIGSKDASAGNYKGTLLGFDGQFIKLEYELMRFVEGASVHGKSIILINATHIRTIEEYRESLNV